MPDREEVRQRIAGRVVDDPEGNICTRRARPVRNCLPRGGRTVATATRRLLAIRDTYAVDIAPGYTTSSRVPSL